MNNQCFMKTNYQECFFFQTNIQQAEVVAGRIAIIQYFNDPGKQIAVAPEN